VSRAASDPFRERARLRRRSFDVLGNRVCFESDHPPLLELAAEAFGGGAPRRGARGTRPFRVRLLFTGTGRGDSDLAAGAEFLGSLQSGNNAVLVSPGSRSAFVAISGAALRTRARARYELLEFAVLTLLARARRLVPLHAGFVVHGRRGALLLGESGAGKSTLCLHAMLERMQFVAEDAVFATAHSCRALGVPTFLHLRHDAARWLRSTALAPVLRDARQIRRRSGVRKLELDLRNSCAALTRAPARISTVVLLRRHAAGRGPILRRIPSSRARAALVATQPYATSRPEWRSFMRSLVRTPSFELRRASHPRESARALRELLERL